MPFLRAIALALTLLATVLIGVPIGWLLGRFHPALAEALWGLACRCILAMLGIRLEHTGPAARKGRLLVANHVSWIDALALASREPLCFLAKREVAHWPLIGALARAQGCVFVDRGRRRSIPAANRAMAARLGEGRTVLLFPEGTTLDGRRRGRFLTSHLGCLRDQLAAEPDRAAAFVQAVAVSYSAPDVAAWVGEATLLPHIWAVLNAPRLVCRLHYGVEEAVPRGTDRKVLGRHLSGTVEQLLAAHEAADPAEQADPPTPAPAHPMPAFTPHRAGETGAVSVGA